MSAVSKPSSLHNTWNWRLPKETYTWRVITVLQLYWIHLYNLLLIRQTRIQHRLTTINYGIILMLSQVRFAHWPQLLVSWSWWECSLHWCMPPIPEKETVTQQCLILTFILESWENMFQKPHVFGAISHDYCHISHECTGMNTLGIFPNEITRKQELLTKLESIIRSHEVMLSLGNFQFLLIFQKGQLPKAHCLRGIPCS